MYNNKWGQNIGWGKQIQDVQPTLNMAGTYKKPLNEGIPLVMLPAIKPSLDIVKEDQEMYELKQ